MDRRISTRHGNIVGGLSSASLDKIMHRGVIYVHGVENGILCMAGTLDNKHNSAGGVVPRKPPTFTIVLVLPVGLTIQVDLTGSLIKRHSREMSESRHISVVSGHTNTQ